MTILGEILSRKDKDELALKINKSRATIYNWIKNPKSMSVADVKLLADAINRSPRNLFSLIINN